MKSKSSVARTFFFVGFPTAAGLVALVYLGFELHRFLHSSPRFNVRSVEVITEGRAEKEEILRLAGISPKDNIFSLDLEQVRKNVEKSPWVYSATVVRALPDKIQIHYQMQVPVAILGAGAMYYLNAEGRPFYKIQRGDSLAYPLLQVEGNAKDSELTRKRVEIALEVLKKLRASKLFNERDLGDITLRAEAEDGAAPLLLTLRYPPQPLAGKSKLPNQLYTVSFGETEIDRQIQHWEAVLRHLAQAGKNPRLIRLELGKKVVVKLGR